MATSEDIKLALDNRPRKKPSTTLQSAGRTNPSFNDTLHQTPSDSI